MFCRGISDQIQRNMWSGHYPPRAWKNLIKASNASLNQEAMASSVLANSVGRVNRYKMRNATTRSVVTFFKDADTTPPRDDAKTAARWANTPPPYV
jgi:hypothetical protein